MAFNFAEVREGAEGGDGRALAADDVAEPVDVVAGLLEQPVVPANSAPSELQAPATPPQAPQGQPPMGGAPKPPMPPQGQPKLPAAPMPQMKGPAPMGPGGKPVMPPQPQIPGH